MDFEWDPHKAAANFVKHGVRFEEAIAVFYDPVAWYQPDWDHSITEIRERVIGESEKGILVVIFTERDGNLIRIISARPTNRKERIDYAIRRRIF